MSKKKTTKRNVMAKIMAIILALLMVMGSLYYIILMIGGQM